MIEVVRKIWDCDKGFSTKIYKIDESKEIQLLKDNEVYAKQVSEFKVVEKDWNCDNDIYELFGAYFCIEGFNEFLTPENIVSMMIEEDLKIEYI